MGNLNLLICPLCKSNDNEFVSSYPGSFLSCKEIMRCQNCELIFANKFPSKKELDKYYSTGLYYDKVSDPYNLEFKNFSLNLSRSRLNLIYSKIIINETPRVLDIGAGNAQLGVVLSERYDMANYDVIEPDEKVTSKYGDWVKKRFSDISELQIGNYDLVVMNQVLEHVFDPLDLLQSVYNLLTSEGYVYIDVPYHDYIFKSDAEPHILFWNQKSMFTVLDQTNYKVIFCDTSGMPHRIAKKFFKKESLINKLINPWKYAHKFNSFMEKIGLPAVIDTFRQFQSNKYGGDRQWLRCIAQKIK